MRKIIIVSLVLIFYSKYSFGLGCFESVYKEGYMFYTCPMTDGSFCYPESICEINYKGIPGGMIKCLNGTWDYSQLYGCIPNASCDVLPTLNGYTFPSSCLPALPMEQCFPHNVCEPGYYGIPTGSVICNKSRWDNKNIGGCLLENTNATGTNNATGTISLIATLTQPTITNPMLTLSFNMPINISSQKNIEFFGGIAVPGNISWTNENKTATIRFYGLEYNITYTVKILSRLQSFYGTYSDGQIFKFTTELNPGCQSPGMWGPDPFTCYNCPEGGVCPGGMIIYAQAGYWTKNTSGILFKCKYADWCTGGVQSCLEGRKSYKCEECEDNWYESSGGHCLKCDPPSVEVLMRIFDIAITGIVILCLVFLKNKYIGHAMFFIKSIQVLRLVGKLSEGALPVEMSWVYRILSIISGESLTQPKCGTKSRFVEEYITNLIQIILSFIAGFLLLSLVYFVKKKRNEKNGKKNSNQNIIFKTKLITMYIILTNFTYSSVLSRNIQVWFCENSTLTGDPTTSCWETEHNKIIILASIFGLVHNVVWPISVFCLLIYMTRQQKMNDIVWMQYFGSLYSSFKKKHYYYNNVWWGFLTLLNVFIFSTYDHPTPRMILTTCLIGLFIVYMLIFRPYKKNWRNITDISILLIAFLGVLVSYFSYSGDKEGTKWTLISMGIFSGLLILVGIIFIVYRKKYSIKTDMVDKMDWEQFSNNEDDNKLENEIVRISKKNSYSSFNEIESSSWGSFSETASLEKTNLDAFQDLTGWRVSELSSTSETGSTS